MSSRNTMIDDLNLIWIKQDVVSHNENRRTQSKTFNISVKYTQKQTLQDKSKENQKEMMSHR